MEEGRAGRRVNEEKIEGVRRERRGRINAKCVCVCVGGGGNQSKEGRRRQQE